MDPIKAIVNSIVKSKINTNNEAAKEKIANKVTNLAANAIGNALDPFGVARKIGSVANPLSSFEAITNPAGYIEKQKNFLTSSAMDQVYGGSLKKEAGKTRANDPISKFSQEIDNKVSSQAPKISVTDDNKIEIIAPDEILKSPYVAQLKEELSSSLIGADLKNPEVTNILDNVNKEIQTNWGDAMRQEYLGWTPEQYKDYQYTLQTIDTANPLTQKKYIKGRDKDGNIKAATPADWVNYYRKVYNTEERTDALVKSMQSKDPYERTMALLLTQGEDHAVYGFDAGERAGKFLKATWEEMEKFPTGTLRLLFTDANTRLMEVANGAYKIPEEAIISKKIGNLSIGDEKSFDTARESVKGKSWSQLSDEEKAFVMTNAIASLKADGSSMPGLINTWNNIVVDTTNFVGNATGFNSLGNILSLRPEERTPEETRQAVIDALKKSPMARLALMSATPKKGMSTEQKKNMDAMSAASISYFLDKSDYDTYNTAWRDYTEWHGYDYDVTGKDAEELEKSKLWASGEIGAGTVVGTIGRFAWEAAVTRALTGGLIPGEAGINIQGISDVVGNHLVGALAKIGLNPTSGAGKFVLQFGANLIGTVPEDILQTSLDNVLTYNAEQNEHLLDPEQLTGNLASNFVIMSLFNAGKAGMSALNKAKMMKEVAKRVDLNQPLNIQELTDIDDISKAVAKGGKLEIEDGKTILIDENGNEKVYDNISEEHGKLIQQSLFDQGTTDVTSNLPNAEVPKVEVDDAIRAADNVADVDGATKANEPSTDIDTTPTTVVEYETPDGKKFVKTPDYNFKGFSDVLKVSPEGTPVGVDLYHKKGVATYMRDFRKFLTDFNNKFGDVTLSDFDWVRHNIEQLGGSEEEAIKKIIGTTDPTTGRVMTKDKIDAMKWWRDQPIIKDLREASLTGIGGNVEGAPNKLGYLPHTDYDPSNGTIEEAMFGTLWRESTGKSVIDENGNYVGYGGTFEDRFKTYVSNMLWDAKNKEIVAAKFVEEGLLDGQEYTPELAKAANNAANFEKTAYSEVGNATSTKNMDKALSNIEVEPTNNFDDIKKAQDQMIKDGEKSGLGQKFHDIYGGKDGSPGVYKGSGTGIVVKQPNKFQANLDTKGNILRKIEIERFGRRMNFGENGAEALIYAPQNAVYVVETYARNGGSLVDRLTDFIESSSHRQRKYAKNVAEKIVGKLGDVKAKNGGVLTKGDAIDVITKSFRGEAWNRIRKFLAIADYDGHIDPSTGKKVGGFNKATKKTIDNFLFSHMQQTAVLNNHKIRRGVAKAFDTLTELRYDALFYGNLKNAVLQLSETARPLTVFKLGDLARMTKKLASDADFRQRVDLMYETVAPKERGINPLDADAYKAYSDIAESMQFDPDGVTFKDSIKGKKDAIDRVALLPIESAEAMKNRTFIASIVQEADRLTSEGKLLDNSEAYLKYVRDKFNRVALANNEMGQIGMATNPISRTMLFLQNFQMREIGMQYYNIKNILTMPGVSKVKKAAQLVDYLGRVCGTKLGTTLALSRLGYSASQTLGIDPFGITDRYTGLSEDEMNWLDKQLTNGALTPLTAGGMFSILSDLYFMSRRAYEESVERDEYGNPVGGGLPFGALDGGDVLAKEAESFIPGSTAWKRFSQMNELMSTGWATSSTGNKMYTAPEDSFDTILGYLFGRSATSNANQYYQSLGKDFGQTFSRTVGKPFQELFGGDYDEFDPIDTKNYSDWFDGTPNDRQQFNKGKWHFQRERDRIVKDAVDDINNTYDEEKKSAIRRRMDRDLDELFDQVERFVTAYEKKNGTISPALSGEIMRMFEYGLEGSETGSDPYSSLNRAQEEYASRGISPVGTYSGPSESSPDKEVSYNWSPQVSAGINYGLYNKPLEAAEILAAEDERVLAPLRKSLRQELDAAYATARSTGDYTAVNNLQKRYLEEFDKVVAPIIAAYGVDIIKDSTNPDKKGFIDQLSAMLNNGSLIPSEHYAKDKWGKYRSMQNEKVDIVKWAKQRYRGDIYKEPMIRSYTSIEDDFRELKNLIDHGSNALARVKAYQIKVRVGNQRRSISEEQLKWLDDFLYNGGK